MKIFLFAFVLTFFAYAENYDQEITNFLETASKEQIVSYEKELYQQYLNDLKKTRNPKARIETAEKYQTLIRLTAQIKEIYFLEDKITVKRALKDLLNSSSKNYHQVASAYIFTHREYQNLIPISEVDWSLSLLDSPDKKVSEIAYENLKNGKFTLNSLHLKSLSNLAKNPEYTLKALTILSSAHNNQKNSQGYYRVFEIAQEILNLPPTNENKALQARTSQFLTKFIQENTHLIPAHFDKLYAINDYHHQLYLMSYFLNEKLEVTPKIIDTLIAYYQVDPTRVGLGTTLLKLAFNSKNKKISTYILDSLEKNNIVLREEFYVKAYLSKHSYDPEISKKGFEQVINSEAIHLLPPGEFDTLFSQVRNFKISPTQHVADYFINNLKTDERSLEALIDLAYGYKNTEIEKYILTKLEAKKLVDHFNFQAWMSGDPLIARKGVDHLKVSKTLNNELEFISKFFTVLNIHNPLESVALARDAAQILEYQATINPEKVRPFINSHLKLLIGLHKSGAKSAPNEIVKESVRLIPYADSEVAKIAFESTHPEIATAATERIKAFGMSQEFMDKVVKSWIENNNAVNARELLIHFAKKNADFRVQAKLANILFNDTISNTQKSRAYELLSILDKNLAANMLADIIITNKNEPFTNFAHQELLKHHEPKSEIVTTVFNGLKTPGKTGFYRSLEILKLWAKEGNITAKDGLANGTHEIFSSSITHEQKLNLLKASAEHASFSDGYLFADAYVNGNPEMQEVSLAAIEKSKLTHTKIHDLFSQLSEKPENFLKLQKLIQALKKSDKLNILANTTVHSNLISLLLIDNLNSINKAEALEILFELPPKQNWKDRQELMAVKHILDADPLIQQKAQNWLNKHGIDSERAFELLLSKLFKTSPDTITNRNSDYAKVLGILDYKVKKELIQQHLMDYALKLKSQFKPEEFGTFDQHVRMLKGKIHLDIVTSDNITRLLKMYLGPDEKLSHEAFAKLKAMGSISKNQVEINHELNAQIARLAENLSEQNVELILQFKEIIHGNHFDEAFTDSLLDKLIPTESNRKNFFSTRTKAIELLGIIPYHKETHRDYVAHKLFELVVVKPNTAPEVKALSLVAISKLNPSRNLQAALSAFLDSEEGPHIREIMIKNYHSRYSVLEAKPTIASPAIAEMVSADNCVVRFLKKIVK